MASNPYGITPVDVGGLLGIVEQKRRSGIEDMLRSRQLAQEDEKLEAARAAREKQGRVDALFTGEKLPEPAEVFRAGGAEAGFEYAKSYAEMKKGEREAAKARVDGLARVGMSLRNLPYPQRRAALEQQADQIASVTGLSREQVLGFDPSDAGIDGIITQSMDVKDQFERIDKDRNYDLSVKRAKDESARGWANVRTAQYNAMKPPSDGGSEKPPAGYRFLPNGDLQAIPGGPAAAKEDEKRVAREGATASFDTAIRTVDGMLKHPGREKAVGIGSMFPTLPATDAANFEADLEAFKAQTFLPMVQALRGMGALSNAEGDKLVNAVGALSLKQDDVQFSKSMKAIRDDLTRARSRATPWVGLTPEQVKALPPGTFFINPKTGQKMVRK